MKTGWLMMISGVILLSLVSWGWQRSRIHPNGRTITSILVLVPSPTPTPKPIVLLFGGDVMWDRHVRQKAEKNGNYEKVLAEIQPMLIKADMVIINLEGPITNNRSVSIDSQVGSANNYIFTFAPTIVDAMMAANIQIVNLGNNHILNFGQTGLTQTKFYLDQADIKYFGDIGRSNRDFSLVKHIRGYTIGLVNYNQFAEGSRERTIKELYRLAPSVDTLIVYTHWGTEYMPVSEPTIKKLARELVDAGANLIVGSHPHVVQDHELYMDTPIYYSLGNMVFDQYFQPEVRQGLLLKVEIEPASGEMALKEIPIEIQAGGEVRLVAGE